MSNLITNFLRNPFTLLFLFFLVHQLTKFCTNNNRDVQAFVSRVGRLFFHHQQIISFHRYLDQYRLEIKALLANGTTQKFIANRYGTTEANLHNWMKKHRIKKGNPMELLP